MTEHLDKRQEDMKLESAFKHSADLSAKILADCMALNPAYFQAHPNLLKKINERLERGAELARSGHYRIANIVQRHAIDLILQENHLAFKSAKSLHKALLDYRDHYEQVVMPLWEKLR